MHIKAYIRSHYEERLADTIVESLDMDSLVSVAKERLMESYRQLGNADFEVELRNFGPSDLYEEFIDALEYQ